jgi:hypothetical protein
MKDLQKIIDTHKMKSNGYSWFSLENYQAKNDMPCYIHENADSLKDVMSYQQMFDAVTSEMYTTSFLNAVLEKYDAMDISWEEYNSYDEIYKAVTTKTTREFAEDFLDMKFLHGEDDLWCSIYTMIEDYIY